MHKAEVPLSIAALQREASSRADFPSESGAEPQFAASRRLNPFAQNRIDPEPKVLCGPGAVFVIQMEDVAILTGNRDA